jgi:2-polyprenyl-3-methyl-5-hydroxy-6-metoxy-1,4-benzoquinol methylase
MSKKEWFEEWFDTSYYHTLYKHRNDEEAAQFIERIAAELPLKNGASVLDLACGKGRHSITLNKLGFNVLGVDLAANSIEKAQVFKNDTLQFAVHDMREIIASQKFAAIFNLFTSFGYFDSIDDNSKVIQAIHEMLEDEGLLIIDFMNATRVINQLVLQEIQTIDGLTFEITRNYDGTHIFKRIQFNDQGKAFDFTERVQALKIADFTQLLVNNGFEIMRTFGDFKLNDYQENDSDRLLIIAKKIK